MKLNSSIIPILNFILIISFTYFQFVFTWQHCAACKVIVDEIEHEIKKVDPKKVLEVEGFRVDPHGNQKKRQILYARSETHLTEITESLCGSLPSYGLSKNKKTGEKKFVRTSSRDGEGMNLENISFSTEYKDQLQKLCNHILEEHDDNIMEFFTKPHEDPTTEFCNNITELCEEEQEEDNDEEEGEEESEAKVEL